jgi:hypothetical protein
MGRRRGRFGSVATEDRSRTMNTSRVSCRCGAVELALAGAPFAQFYCHCDDCQAMHGAAYVPEAAYHAGDVAVVRGIPALWTLRRNPHAFCGSCGARLFIDVLEFKVRGVSGALLPAFVPTFHMHCRYAVRSVRDGLPHYAGMPARFGGTDATVDW